DPETVSMAPAIRNQESLPALKDSVLSTIRNFTVENLDVHQVERIGRKLDSTNYRVGCRGVHSIENEPVNNPILIFPKINHPAQGIPARGRSHHRLLTRSRHHRYGRIRSTVRNESLPIP